MGYDTSKWRFDTTNYFHHMFTGDQAVVAKGKVIGFGKMKEAIDLAEKYLASHPGTLREDVLIKPKINLPSKPTTLLSQTGFWAFTNKLADKLGVSVDDVLAEMQGVAGIKPRPRFVGALLERKANLEGYMKNPEYVYKALWGRLTRKQVLDPFGRAAQMKLTKIGQTELKNEMQQYIDTIMGKYEEPTTLVGINLDKALQTITKSQSILKLGYRPSTAFINRLQPLQTAYPIIGNDLFRGSAMRFTKLGKELITKSGILAEQPKYYAGEWKPLRATKSGQGVLGKIKEYFHPLFLFGKAEQANREETLLGGYIFAKRRYKFDDTKALEFGKELVNSTQFLYNTADLPKVFRSPIGRTILQFKPFAINYLYNAKNLLTGQELGGLERFGLRLTPLTKIARATKWLGVNFAVGGLRTLLQLATPAGLGFVSYLAIKHPRLMQGALSYLGIDVSKRAGATPWELFQIQDVGDLLGPGAGDVQRIVQSIYKYEKSKDKKDLADILRINPMAWNVYQAMAGTKVSEKLHLPKEEMAVAPKKWERFLTAMGFEPSRLSTVREGMTFLKYFQPDQRSKALGLPTPRAIENLIYNLKENKNYPDQKKKNVIAEMLNKLGIKPDQYQSYLDKRKERLKKATQEAAKKRKKK
jgi:hypothetical protein